MRTYLGNIDKNESFIWGNTEYIRLWADGDAAYFCVFFKDGKPYIQRIGHNAVVKPVR
jgi:hypothetical protein